VLGSFRVDAQSDYYHEDFAWSYQGSDWTWSLDIPKALYDAYKQVPVSTRTRHGFAGYGYLTTTNDYYLQTICEKLNETAAKEGFDSFEEVSFVLAFVQSLPYTSDSVTTGYDEYPRFPIETLVDGGGDCEDTAILFATFTLIMNYGTVYINPPEHLAVGVLGEDLPGSYFTFNNQRYYYCETTGDGFEIGEIPSEFENEEAKIYEIKKYQQYEPLVTIIPTPTPTSIPTPTPSPTVTPVPTSTPTPTNKANPTSAPSNMETPLPSVSFLPRAFYAAAAIGVAIVVGVTFFALKRQDKQQNREIPPHPPLSPPP